MTKEERIAADREFIKERNRMGEKQAPYCADVEERTGIQLAKIIESMEQSGLELKILHDVPEASGKECKNAPVSMVVLAPGGVGAIAFFYLRKSRRKRKDRKHE